MTKNSCHRLLAAALAALLVIAPVTATPGPLGKMLGKAAMARLFRQDFKNHAAVVARPLSRPRTVHRFTTTNQARREVGQGLAPNAHMTATARPGRPLSAEAAQRRYGLPAKPQVRETIRLTAGTSLRHTHAAGAARGVGELTSPRPLPPTVIRKVTPLSSR